VEVDAPIVRLERLNVTLAGGLDVIDQTNLFPTGAILTSDRLRVAWARAAASAIRRLGPGVVLQTDLSVSIRLGIEGLGASQSSDPYLSRPEGRPDGWTGRMESNHHLLLANLIDIGLHVQAQYAPMPVLAYEQLALGNLTIGRGYDPDSVSGDYGVAGELTGGLLPVRLGHWATLAPYGFFDAGTVNSRSIDSQWTMVRAYGGGVRLRLAYGVVADVYYAAPMDKPFPAALSKPSQRLIVQVAIAR
jgi:hemolysin activation/secretion protein